MSTPHCPPASWPHRVVLQPFAPAAPVLKARSSRSTWQSQTRGGEMPLRRRHGPGAAVPTAPEAQKAGGGARRSRPGSSRPHLSLGQMQTSRGLQLTRRQRGQAGRCRCDRPAPQGGYAAPRGMWGTHQSALEGAEVDAGVSRRRGANGGRTTTTSTSVGIAKCGTSAMAGHHAAGKHAATGC